MARAQRVSSAPRSAVLYVYNPNTVDPAPIEPAPDSLIVLVPTSSSDLDAVRTFMADAARTMGLSFKESVAGR
jgi:hypothetical protein